MQILSKFGLLRFVSLVKGGCKALDVDVEAEELVHRRARTRALTGALVAQSKTMEARSKRAAPALTMRDSSVNPPRAARPPSIALLIGRWGRWPGWTPLLFRTFALNPTIAFCCLSDTPPAIDSSRLPTNVRHSFADAATIIAPPPRDSRIEADHALGEKLQSGRERCEDE